MFKNQDEHSCEANQASNILRIVCMENADAGAFMVVPIGKSNLKQFIARRDS